MTVSRITELTKSRVKIETDEEFAFVLYKGELRLYHLEEGGEIPEETVTELFEQVLPKRARLRAMNLLKARPYTKKQLTDKLRAGEYPEEIVEDAILYVASFGYLDDRQYAADYIEYHKEDKSRTAIKNTLLGKGIDKELFEEVWQDCAGEEAWELEKEQILAWCKKKNFEPTEADYEERQKFSAFLYRKGFEIDTIRKVLSLDITIF